MFFKPQLTFLIGWIVKCLPGLRRLVQLEDASTGGLNLLQNSSVYMEYDFLLPDIISLPGLANFNEMPVSKKCA